MSFKIIESKRPLFVKVEKQDVDRAITLDKQFCAFAMATRRQVRGLIDIEVGTTITKLLFHNKMIRFVTSPEAKKRLTVFDRTGEWPFDYGKNLIGLPMTPGQELNRERDRVKGLRAQGKCKATGIRAAQGKPRRKAARRISPRHINFSMLLRQERLAARSEMVIKSTVNEIGTTAAAPEFTNKEKTKHGN